MKNNEINKETEYNELFNEFINSSEDKLFSKQEVKKIIEAHMYSKVFSRFEDEPVNKSKNIFVTTKAISRRIFNVKSILSFILSYIFYLGFLVLIMNFIYKDLLGDKFALFIIALAFAFIDKIVKPLLFIADLITLTIVRFGLVTITIYTIVFFILGNTLSLTTNLSIEKAVLVSVIVLLLTFVIDFIKKDSVVRTKYIDEDENGSDDDEQNNG